MRNTFAVVALAVAMVTAGACDPQADDERGDGRSVRIDGAQLVGLVTEDDCGELLSWFRSQADVLAAGPRYGPGVLVADAQAGAAGAQRSTTGAPEALATTGGATPKAGVDYSATNVQESGVDEPDIVKTDGRRVLAVAGGRLRVVDVSGDSPVLLSTTMLAVQPQEMLLVGDRAMVFGAAPAAGDDAVGIAVPKGGSVPYGAPRTTVVVVDVGDGRSPRIESEVTLDGSYVSARLVDGVARVVLRSSPVFLQQRWVYPGQEGVASEEVARDRNRATVDQSTIDDWIPRYRYAEPGNEAATTEGRLTQCDAVHHPTAFSGPELVTVVALDPADPRPGNAASVAGAGETVYASAERLYVSSMRWEPVDLRAQLPAGRVTGASTALHAFDIGDEVTTRYLGSGSVEGTLLNQFSLSEHEGVLRVATTRTAAGTGETDSQVVALRLQDGSLQQIGAVGGLGKTERIHAVRFLGEQAYVVTFRQTDPLYVIDLADPTAPALRGELKIPGFSSYLHPIGDDRLVGIGQDATEEGQRLGTQLSLFDVSDAAAPKRLATFDLSSRGSPAAPAWEVQNSEAEYDHRAFLWWAPSRLVVVPFGSQAVAVRVEGDELVAAGRTTNPPQFADSIRRSIVVRSTLLTMAESGLAASALDGLAPRGHVAFP